MMLVPEAVAIMAVQLGQDVVGIQTMDVTTLFSTMIAAEHVLDPGHVGATTVMLGYGAPRATVLINAHLPDLAQNAKRVV